MRGPTVFTMRWVFDQLFDEAGATFADHVRLRHAETLARHAWSDSERLDLFADPARSADAIGVFAGKAEAEGFLRFAARARAIYETLRDSFILAQRPSPVDLVRHAGFGGLPNLLRISPFATMWDELGKYFRDPRLRQLFGRYATYCGSSPFSAPATLMLVAHVEMDGVWLVEGGMHRLARALADLAQARGATFRYGREARRIVIEAGHASGVVLADGERLDADAIIMNGDVAALRNGLLGDDARGAAGKAPPVQSLAFGDDAGDARADAGLSASASQRLLFARLPRRVRRHFLSPPPSGAADRLCLRAGSRRRRRAARG